MVSPVPPGESAFGRWVFDPCTCCCYIKYCPTYVDKIEGEEIFFIEHFYKRGQNRYRLNLKLHTLEMIEHGERNGPAEPNASNARPEPK